MLLVFATMALPASAVMYDDFESGTYLLVPDGAMGLYTEDARVNFDNVNITVN